MKRQVIIPVLALTFFLLSGCAVNPVTGKKDFMLLSEQAEINMGRQSDPAIVASYGLYEDEAMQNFIDVRGKEMAAISHRPQLDFEFKILDSPVINAFAVPGGYVYFTRGIMAHFNNEAEFAGVLGHEIGHITARHSAKMYSKNILFQVGFIAGLVVSPEFASFADVAQEGLGLLFLKFSRDHESESDELGVEYSTSVGYDAHHMADFFKTLERMRGDEGGSIPTFMSTHPDPRDRFNTVHALASEAQANIDQSQLKENRSSYLDMIDGLIYGEDPKQGFEENGVFYHPELLFQFPVPTDWRVANSPSQVQMAPKSGDALIIFTLAKENSLQAAAEATMTENQLTLVDQKNSNVSGFNALVVVTDMQNPQNPQAITRILSYYIQDGNYIYEFHGLTAKEDYQSYAALFANTMKGYRRLNDQDKINRLPERIAIKAAPMSADVATVFTALQVPADRHEEVALLNGLDLKETVEAGTKLKTLSR